MSVTIIMVSHLFDNPFERGPVCTTEKTHNLKAVKEFILSTTQLFWMSLIFQHVGSSSKS